MQSNHLTAAQQLAAHSTAQNILVTANPGSGKTRTLVERIAHVIKQGTLPAHVVAISFTNAAAQELEQRLGVNGHNLPPLGHCGTIHSFALRLLRNHGALVGIPTRVAIADNETRDEMIARVVRDQKYRGTQKALAEAIAKGPQKFARHMNATELAAQSYFTTMVDSGILDFDMILHYGRLLAEKMCGANYEHLLVDEVQDLSDLEFAFLEALAIPKQFYSGDDAQALYAFKGGNVKHILALSKDKDWTTYVLSENFRCGKVICEMAQKLIEHNTARFPKVTVSATGYDGEVELGRNAPSENAELSEIAEMIRAITILDVFPEAPRQSVAVLYRTNWLARQAAEYFERSGIAVARKQSLAHPEDWRKACLLVALCANPHSDVAAYMYLKLKHGVKYAENIATAAAVGMVPLSKKVALKRAMNRVDDLPGLFVDEDISFESISKTAHCAATLPADATLNDLALAMGRTEEERDAPTDGITVCTIHKFKGREADVVFLPAFEDSTIPGRYETPEELEESRRIAYVAVTRARHRLVITYARERIPQGFGEQSPVAVSVQPSRFIAEMGWA